MLDRHFIHRVLRKLNRHRTTELYFVGYPKTGNTWLMYMLGRYLQLFCDLPHFPLFDTADHLGRCERACVGPRLQFTHRPLLWDRQRAEHLNYQSVIRPFEGKRIVLIIRNPLDTLVSFWMQRRYRGARDYSGTLVDFLESPIFGLEKFFGFYGLWFNHRDRVKDFKLLRYEDMRSDSQSGLVELLNFLEIPVQGGVLQQALADSAFESMKKVEASGEAPILKLSGYSIFGAADRSNPNAFHVRRGKVGGFRDYLGEEDAERLLTLIDRRLPSFYGYSWRAQH
jgi:Sulfotransferase domain